jgi:hypothetical protein
MKPLRSWLAAARPGRALLAPLGVAVGSSYAHFDAQRGPGFPAHVLAMLGAYAAGLGVNLVDHAWDLWEAPPPDPKTPAPESLRPVDFQESGVAGLGALALATLCGLGLVPLSGAAALGYGALAVILGAARGAPVFGLEALGLGFGEAAALLALGPLAALAGFASQAGTGSSGALLAGIPAGLIATVALLGRHLTRPGIDPGLVHRAAVGLPLVAAAAVSITARAGEYGPWAHAAALPLALTAAAAWRLPAPPSAGEADRWGRLALACAVAALATIAAAFRIASPE